MIEGLKRQEINEIRQNLRAWYNRPVGQVLLAQERELLDEALPTLFGYHIVQIGCLLGNDLLANSRVPHRVLLDPDGGGETLLPHVYSYPDAIPIATGAVDVAVLPHTLEFERDPHQILREVDRILIPEGHVVILGFNPWSFWGLWRKFLGKPCGRAPWCGDFLSMTRINDWLALLGFEVVTMRQHFFRPPLQHRSLMKKLSFLETAGSKCWPSLGGAYMLIAKKRVITMTPIKPSWRSQRKLVGGLVRPSTRSSSND